MKFNFFLFIFCAVYCFNGCKTIHEPKAQPQAQEEMESALSSIAGSVAGQPVSKEELKNLGRQLRSDPEAKAAVENITNTLTMPSSGIKYCPEDGKRFSERLEMCPEHHILLKVLE